MGLFRTALLVLALYPNAVWCVDHISLGNDISLDNVSAVKALVEKGEITINERILAEGYSREPGIPILGLAAREGAINVAKYLVAQKADLEAATGVAETPLMFASFFSDNNDDTSRYEIHEKIVDLLLAAGAKVENAPNKYTAIAYASYYNHIRIVKKLLDHGARVDSDAANGRCATNTALIFSAMNGHEEQARLLLEHNANPRIVNAANHDALYFAEKNNNKEIAKVLRCAIALKPGEKFADFCKK